MGRDVGPRSSLSVHSGPLAQADMATCRWRWGYPIGSLHGNPMTNTTRKPARGVLTRSNFPASPASECAAACKSAFRHSAHCCHREAIHQTNSSISQPDSGALKHDFIEVKARGFLARREFLEARQPLRGRGLRRDYEKCPVGHPFALFPRFRASLEGIASEIVHVGSTQARELSLPYFDGSQCTQH